jgi:hypothetical protein
MNQLRAQVERAIEKLDPLLQDEYATSAYQALAELTRELGRLIIQQDRVLVLAEELNDLLSARKGESGL